MKIRVKIEGDVARALTWEAGRRGIDTDDLVRRLVRDSSRQIFVNWRQIHWGVHFLNPIAPVESTRSFREVLRKARGPARS